MKLNTTLLSIAGAMMIGAALFSLESCNKQIDPNTIAFNRIDANESFRAIGSAEEYESDSDLCIKCKAELLMPTAIYEHDIKALQDSIYSYALDTTSHDIATLTLPALRRQAENMGFAITDTTACAEYDGYFSTYGNIVNLTPTFMSYGVTNSTYYPRAAHGMYSSRYINYDLTDGKIISLEDILTEEGFEKIIDFIREASEYKGVRLLDSEINSLPANNNFYINNELQLVFVYQPYEIAPYSEGIINIPINIYMISDLITPYGANLLGL